ncbi:threonine/serine dehydratase [Steroidobacter sp.]|uniref:threonine ammonia-lyase n=1 Tax=Steroidobacter sp. TaxID=1978227 RepID=UPI001A3CB647|nr:threonine/serine dehydratase [Steroidobacter sp.]MBL8270936.1 threonine/serine dehydratase [Steroidobacter sp.]
MPSLDRVRLGQIAKQLAPHIHTTPMWRSDTLSRLTGHEVYLKAELLQKTGSYKPRGMLWALMNLEEERRKRGVITFSAGNAAQGLAYAGRILNVPITVTMPAAASPTKAQATRDYGAEVFLHGVPKECLQFCTQLASERGLTFISSYDNAELMEGHATLGLELTEQLPDMDALFLGVGGGGMLGGVAMALQACGSNAKLIGVEPHGAPAMFRSFEAGQAITLDGVSTIADGLAAPGSGRLCYEAARPRTERIVLVSDDEITVALKLLMERCKLFAEPAGAAALAGLLSVRNELAPGSKVCCVVSGGNLDLQRLKALL